MVRSKSVIATPPGATIKEQLSDRELSQKEFAARMGMSEKHISKLVNGDVRLTPDVAYKLEMVLGIPAKFWNNLEAIYQEKLIAVKAENDMDKDIEISKNFPYNEMAENNWVPKTNKPKERVTNLRKFFEVADLSLIDSPQVTKIACRKLSESEKSYYTLIAWAQRAKIEARDIFTNEIDLKSLKSRIPEIRNMTVVPPEEFCDKLKQLLAECGIALVFLPHMKGSFLQGATFCSGRKIVIGMTVRGKDADKFWFSLFHEIAHILYGHILNMKGTSEEDEKAADNFAENTLIERAKFEEFVSDGIFSEKAILSFAEKINVDTGIVVGRLQKEGYIQYSRFNNLKKHYKIN